MIALWTENALYTRLLQESLAPLGQSIGQEAAPYHAAQASESDPAPAPDCLIIWHDHAPAPAPDCPVITMGVDIALPFRAGALCDRVRSLLGQDGLSIYPDKIPLGGHCLEPRHNIIALAHTDKPVRLTQKERDILLMLYDAHPHSVTRQALIDRIWAYAPTVETHTVETHIYRLRQKIEQDPSAPNFLITDDNGYRLAL